MNRVSRKCHKKQCVSPLSHFISRGIQENKLASHLLSHLVFDQNGDLVLVVLRFQAEVRQIWCRRVINITQKKRILSHLAPGSLFQQVFGPSVCLDARAVLPIDGCPFLDFLCFLWGLCFVCSFSCCHAAFVSLCLLLCSSALAHVVF